MKKSLRFSLAFTLLVLASIQSKALFAANIFNESMASMDLIDAEIARLEVQKRGWKTFSPGSLNENRNVRAEKKKRAQRISRGTKPLARGSLDSKRKGEDEEGILVGLYSAYDLTIKTLKIVRERIENRLACIQFNQVDENGKPILTKLPAGPRKWDTQLFARDDSEQNSCMNYLVTNNSEVGVKNNEPTKKIIELIRTNNIITIREGQSEIQAFADLIRVLRKSNPEAESQQRVVNAALELVGMPGKAVSPSELMLEIIEETSDIWSTLESVFTKEAIAPGAALVATKRAKTKKPAGQTVSTLPIKADLTSLSSVKEAKTEKPLAQTPTAAVQPKSTSATRSNVASSTSAPNSTPDVETKADERCVYTQNLRETDRTKATPLVAQRLRTPVRPIVNATSEDSKTGEKVYRLGTKVFPYFELLTSGSPHGKLTDHQLLTVLVKLMEQTGNSGDFVDAARGGSKVTVRINGHIFRYDTNTHHRDSHRCYLAMKKLVTERLAEAGITPENVALKTKG